MLSWMVCLPAGAQTAEVKNYPARAVRMVNPSSPGGGADIIGRLVGAQFSKTFGQNFMTDNRPGAANIIATEIAPAVGERSPLNPGPFQFCTDRTCPDRWIASRGWLRCSRSEVREIMRPIPLQATGVATIGLCDGIHRDDHEFVSA